MKKEKLDVDLLLRTIIPVMHSPVKFAHLEKTVGDNVWMMGIRKM